MPPSTLDQDKPAAADAAAEQVAAGHAATLRRRAREIAEADEARRRYRWWRDFNVWFYGGAPVGAVASGIVLMLAGEGLGTSLLAVGVGTIVGLLALALSFVLVEPFADNFVLFPFLTIAIAAVTAAAGTLLVAAYLN